jgi:hypothetical protein
MGLGGRALKYDPSKGEVVGDAEATEVAQAAVPQPVGSSEGA